MGKSNVKSKKRAEMNTLFTRQIRPDMSEQEETPRQVTVFVENKTTNTFGFVLKSKARPGVSPELTLQDRRELAGNNPPLMNETLNAHAKAIYAAGGRTKDIERWCKVSPDYAAKLHAAFGRTKTCNCKKRY